MRIAFVTLFERKIFGYVQLRKGPNKVLFSGILQPIADGIKLFIKENSYRLNMNKILFIIFPSLSFLLILIF